MSEYVLEIYNNDDILLLNQDSANFSIIEQGALTSRTSSLNNTLAGTILTPGAEDLLFINLYNSYRYCAYAYIQSPAGLFGISDSPASAGVYADTTSSTSFPIGKLSQNVAVSYARVKPFYAVSSTYEDYVLQLFGPSGELYFSSDSNFLKLHSSITLPSNLLTNWAYNSYQYLDIPIPDSIVQRLYVCISNLAPLLTDNYNTSNAYYIIKKLLRVQLVFTGVTNFAYSMRIDYKMVPTTGALNNLGFNTTYFTQTQQLLWALL